MKICNKCKLEKEKTEFYKDLAKQDSLSTVCKSCKKEQQTQNKEKLKQYNKKYFSSYYQKNSERLKEYQKKYREQNKDKIFEKKKRYWQREEIKEKKRKYDKIYREKNQEQIKKKKLEYFNERRQSDINFKILTNLRGRIKNAINKQYGEKAKKTIELLGCSIEECRKHIESLFQPGMTWDNYGKFGWHIDHILPCASFDLTKIEEQKKCFHYTNLQPLWAEDNLKKSDKSYYLF
jgi:hypothetical protein